MLHGLMGRFWFHQPCHCQCAENVSFFKSGVLNYMEDGVSTGVNKRVTLIITAIAAFVGSFMSSALNVALPTIGKEFAAEAVLLGWVANAMTLAQAMTLIPAGRFADIYGRKKVFVFSMLFFAVSSFLCTMANSVVFLIICRVFQGIGAGITITTSIAVLTSVFPAEERGKALGINVAATYSGLSLGPVLGGVLTQNLGWRSIFFLSGFLCLAVAVIVFRGLRGEWADARGEKFDGAGSVVFIISLVMILYGFTVLLTTLGIVLVLLGALGMFVFIWWEARTASPVLDTGLFRKNTVFVFSNLATLINYLAAFAVGFLLSLYLQYVKGFSPQIAGLILVAQPVVMAIFAPMAGRLSDRTDPRIVASVGMAFTFVALLLFVFLTENTALWFIIVALAVCGFGMSLFSSPNTNAIMGSVGKRLLGVASGTVATMRTCGMTLSMGIVMILFSIYIGKAQITPEYYPAFLVSMKVGFIISAALCFGGIFAQLAGRRAK
jgi:EmrB/QacA subfamily drug resistance transporter